MVADAKRLQEGERALDVAGCRRILGGAAAGDAEASLHGPCVSGSTGRPDRRRPMRAAVLASVVIAVLVVAGCCLRFGPGLYRWLADPSGVHAFVEEHALLSRLALVGINVVQVLLAFLPGEPIELASGYAFGFWEGTAMCLLASGIGSSLAFFAVRRWGWRVMGLFFSREQFERYRWMRDARRLELIMLVVFLIPGTPKDFLTYFAGLTRMGYPSMLAIATVGRIPSIVTSTIAASAMRAGEYGVVAASFAIAIALACAGALACRGLERRGGAR